MRNFFLLVCLAAAALIFTCCKSGSHHDHQALQLKPVDSLPLVFEGNSSDLIDNMLRHEARLRFAGHQLPDNPEEWRRYKENLRAEIISKAGVVIDHKLPVDMKETGSVRMKGYTIKNIIFQTRPGIYATANLFIPDGKGPFPAVINMLGHWRKGKIDATGPQAVGHTLATNGYVCLTIDPWGAGERGTRHGDFEYHGSNLGASLMNIGEPLIGMQISDNMRGIDLLCSLPVVDAGRIGATGASGGGNQTMWLSAVDERVMADVPVVSVGTFESYIMESNCICEQLPDGLTFTEEAGIVALSHAPLLLNHNKDSNPTFYPSETIRTFTNAARIFKLEGREKDIAFRRFDLEHGYEREDREAMLGWFDYQLKGTGDGTPRKELPFQQLPEDKLMVYSTGTRDASVMSTDEYCRKKGSELRNDFLGKASFDQEIKWKELKDILRINNKLSVAKISRFSASGGWDRLALETADQQIFPLLQLAPSDEESGYVIIASPEGKKGISLALIDSLRRSGAGIVVADLTGTGELTSLRSAMYDYTGKLHTLSRAELWLGRTMLGEWTKELDLISQYLFVSCKAKKISIAGYREAGLAGLFYGALGGKIQTVTLIDAPVSYLFDNREKVDYFSMGIHLPGFLKWGDLSLAAAISNKNLEFIHPVTMSGTPLTSDQMKEVQAEYDKIKQLCKGRGSTTFI